MPELVLTRATTYEYMGYSFVRGKVKEVPMIVYQDGIRKGWAKDPNQHIDFVDGPMVRAARPGTTVPVMRDCGLGDVLMASIPLRDFCYRNKHVNVVYGVSPQYVGLFEGLSFCKVAPIPEIRGSFQFGVDLRGFVERDKKARKQDRIDIFSRALNNAPPTSYDFPLQITAEHRDHGRHYLGASRDDRPVLGLVMRASLANRSWGIDYLQATYRLADSNGWRVILIDGRERRSPSDPPWRDFFPATAIDLCGKLSMTDLRDVVAACDCILSPDTGLVHLAEAVGTKCVAYFTTVPPELRVGHYRHVKVLYPRGQLPCLGCMHSPTCGQPDPKPCAVLSTPQMAWDAIEAHCDHTADVCGVL